MASLFKNLTDRFTTPKERDDKPDIITPARPSTSTSSGTASLLSYDDSHLAPFAPLSASSSYASSFGEANLRTPSISTASKISEPGLAPASKGPFGLTCLSSPSAPPVKIDIIFVHGLGGDSFKTWCVGKKPETYWPKEWLPREAGFENVRTWSWGYSSFLAKGEENILNIHHLGKGLLTALNDHPMLREEDTKIIAVGHSMGGLVIKKAYNLADVDPLYKPLAARIRAITFLATPHHGADGAKFLANLFSVLGHDRHYVKDLSRNSGAIQEISETFRHHAPNLYLTSFYETRKSKVSAGKVMIVDEHSARLGYPSEKTVPLDADHRGVCKFSDQKDPNYALVRNHLAFTINQIFTGDGVVAKVLSPKEAAKKVQRKQEEVRTWLGVGTTGDHDHIHARDARLPGSCEWIAEKPVFQGWRDETDSRFLWLNAKPGSGKTILAGYAIDHIRKLKQPCAHWYFKFGDHKKSSLGRCLKSLLYQMAKLDEGILEIVSGMKDQGVGLGVNDVDVRQFLLYLRQFDILSTFKGYWVIDALDECSDIFPLLDTLRSVADALSVRILFTSRMTRDLRTAFAKLSAVGNISIEPEDTAPDLRKMIRFYLEPLDILEFSDDSDDEGEDHPLVTEIIATSKGSLLWASLVLSEAQDCDTIKELRSVLQAVPDTMDAFYERSLAMMSQNRRRIPLLKSVLRWACCAHTPLTLPELKQALKIELDDDFIKLKELIETNCGQLVTVDASGGLNVIHKSAGDYLMSGKEEGETSELCVDVGETHAKMACVCLEYLTSKEMKPPRSTEGRDLGKVIDRRSVFHTYASTAFSYHISMADSSNLELLGLLEKFFAANVLSWIEASAAIFGLNKVTDAGKHFNNYLQNRQREKQPLQKHHELLQYWAIDLVRLVDKFGNALMTAPSSIFGIIPPAAPRNSMIHNVRPQSRTLSVLGNTGVSWDDRVMNMDMGTLRQGMTKTWDRTWQEATSQVMDFVEQPPMNVAYGQHHLAVSVPTETADLVRVYNTASNDLEYEFDHGEVVTALEFDGNTGYLAVVGLSKIRIVNVPRKQDMYVLSVPECPMCLGFFGSELRVVGQDQYIYAWHLGDEAEQLPSFEHTDVLEPDALQPVAGSISVAHNLLSLAYSDNRIETWDLNGNVFVSSMECSLIRADMVFALVIQPSADREPLIASLWNNQTLAILDPFTKSAVQEGPGRGQSISVSPNGRFIGVGIDFGIAIHDFDSLTELYLIRMQSEPCYQLRFSPDSLRVVDTHGSNCVAWEPAILAYNDPLHHAKSQNGGRVFRDLDTENEQDVLVAHPTEDAVFCGRENGEILVYSRKLPYTPKVLYEHHGGNGGTPEIKWCPKQESLLSFTSTDICIQSVSKFTSGWEAGHVYDTRRKFTQRIVDALVSRTSDHFVVCSKETYYVHEMDSEACREVAYTGRCPDGPCSLATHPTIAEYAVSIDDVEIRIHRWDDWSLVMAVPMPGNASFSREPDFLKYTVLFHVGDYWHLLDSFSGYLRSQQHQPMVCLEYHDAPPGRKPSQDSIDCKLHKAEPRLGLSKLDIMIKHVIGLTLNRLIFLSQASWVCSLDLNQVHLLAQRDSRSWDYQRHFYVPSEWLPPPSWFHGRIAVCTVSQGDIIFACSGGLLVIRNFMEHSETVRYELDK